WADRRTAFAGNDVSTISTGLPAFTSSIAESTKKTAFLANLEASASVSPSPAWKARAFVGLNYDDSVPGFAAPVTLAPVRISYSHETSYYAGGGVTYKFH